MVQNGVTGIPTIVGIAVGVAIPKCTLAQKYLKARKERRIQQYSGNVI